MQRLAAILRSLRDQLPPEQTSVPCGEHQGKGQDRLHSPASSADLEDMLQPACCCWACMGPRNNGQDAEQKIATQLDEYQSRDRTGHDSAGCTGGPAVPQSSCAEKTADSPLGEPAGTSAGILPAAGAEVEDDCLFNLKMKLLDLSDLWNMLLLLPGDSTGAWAQSIAEERSRGILPAAGAAEEDDSLLDPEMGLLDENKLLRRLLQPAADRAGACTQSFAGESSSGVLPAAGAAEGEGASCSETQVSALEREEMHTKEDASTQVDFQDDLQRQVRQLQQELASALKKNALTEVSLEAAKRRNRDLMEYLLQLQEELDRSSAKPYSSPSGTCS